MNDILGSNNFPNLFLQVIEGFSSQGVSLVAVLDKTCYIILSDLVREEELVISVPSD